MQELLARLKKVNPRTYADWLDMEGVYPEKGYELGDTELDCLQGTIQRAIEARGWAYQVSLTFQGTSFGKIITKDGDGSKRFHPDQAGDSPAAAILSAYLQALEANHVQPR